MRTLPRPLFLSSSSSLADTHTRSPSSPYPPADEGESYNIPLVTGIVRELFTVNSPSRPAGSEGQLGSIEGPLGLRVYSRDETRERPRAFPGRMVVAFEGIKGKR